MTVFVHDAESGADESRRQRGHGENSPESDYRTRVRAIRRLTVRTVLPEALASLGELVDNLRWSWHPPTQEVFAAVDPDLWEAVRHDPVRLLGRLRRSG